MNEKVIRMNGLLIWNNSWTMWAHMCWLEQTANIVNSLFLVTSLMVKNGKTGISNMLMTRIDETVIVDELFALFYLSTRKELKCFASYNITFCVTCRK